jgi:hypothetical protein
VSLWRGGAGRPPSLDPARILDAAARLDVTVDPNGLAASLKACAGEGDPVSAATKAAALAFSLLPDAPTRPSEILSLWVFDMVIAIQLRWPRPVPLIAVKILDPSLRSNGRERPRPGGPAWPNAAAGAIALAAASALDLVRGRAYDLALVAGGYRLQTKTRFAPAIRVAHPSRAGDNVAELTKTETFALTAIAYLQPVTRGEISKLAGREISRDVIGALKRHGLIDGAIRAPRPGAPFAYVTTRNSSKRSA